VRAGELAALRRSDIDLEHGVVNVHRSVDRFHNRGRIKSTKTGQGRRVPIEPTLMPLLDSLCEGLAADDPLFAMPPGETLSSQLRTYLERAGIARAELFANDETRKHLTFHDLRATGITWLAVRGDEPLRIQARAGHSSFSTTQGYVREAEILREGFGEVFPELPPELSAGQEGFGFGFGLAPHLRAQPAGFTMETLRPQGDSKVAKLVKRRDSPKIRDHCRTGVGA
jgi:integrase